MLVDKVGFVLIYVLVLVPDQELGYVLVEALIYVPVQQDLQVVKPP